MDIRLYLVNGSHPCVTVEKALQMKHLPYSVVELPPPAHMAFMKLRFGKRTVPGIEIDGEKISGSREILRRLDLIVPEPPLFPADPVERAAVEEAESWGDDILQPMVRRLLWPTFKAHPELLAAYSEGSKLPPIPAPVLKASAPLITTIEMKANGASEVTYREDLRTLPAVLDHVDGLVAAGTIGGEQPNAADLQILPSLALLMTMADLRALIEPRPCGQATLRLFPDTPVRAPSGSIPAGLLPAAA